LYKDHLKIKEMIEKLKKNPAKGVSEILRENEKEIDSPLKYI